MSFSSIATRANGQKILYSWFNDLKTAGMLLDAFLGTGMMGETAFTIANNQSSATNVTGLLFSSGSYKAAHIYASVRRKTDSSEVVSNGRIIVQYRAATTTWELLDELSGDDDGVTFSITSGGQVQYASTNQSGANYSATMTYRAITFST